MFPKPAVSLADTVDLTRPKSNVRTLIKMMAAGEDANETAIERAYTTLVPVSATGDYLTAWAALRGLQRRAEGRAKGRVTVSPVIQDNTFAQLRPGHKFADADGNVFEYSGAIQPFRTNTLQGIQLTAAQPGPDGNIPVGTVLTPTVSLGKDVVVTTINNFLGGSVAETDDELRSRLIRAFRSPLTGINSNSWETTARQVPNVESANVRSSSGIVIVYPLMVANTRPPHGIPSSADLAAVRAELAKFAPVGTDFRVVSPEAVTIDVEIGDLFPDNAVVRTAVRAAITQALTDARAVGGVFAVSAIYQAVAAAAGVSRFTVDSPSANEDLGDSKVPVIGTITFN